jgi:hypothetical protein
MCRADVHPDARAALAAVLIDMRGVLAAQADVDPDEVRIGPVDFGPEEGEQE